jgi:hypothetical protein
MPNAVNSFPFDARSNVSTPHEFYAHNSGSLIGSIYREKGHFIAMLNQPDAQGKGCGVGGTGPVQPRRAERD